MPAPSRLFPACAAAPQCGLGVTEFACVQASPLPFLPPPQPLCSLFTAEKLERNTEHATLVERMRANMRKEGVVRNMVRGARRESRPRCRAGVHHWGAHRACMRTWTPLHAQSAVQPLAQMWEAHNHRH